MNSPSEPQNDLKAASDPLAGGFALPPGRALDICHGLHAAILEHRLEPGAKLSEDEVGEIYGVSRTVVRTALQALTHSGLVVVVRNRGAFVSKPSVREGHEVFETRALIEPRIARMAAAAARPSDVEALHRHVGAEHAALSNGDMGRALSLSGAFHLAISQIAGHSVMDAIVRSLIARSSLVIALYWRRPDTACESHSHDALIEAIARNDAGEAEAIMRSHIVDLHSGLDLTERPRGTPKLAEILKG